MHDHCLVFHATTEEGWSAIQKSGFLEPRLPTSMYPRSSLVYLAYDPVRALEHGDVLLAVRLSDLQEPGWLGGSDWQIGTAHPIPVGKVRRLPLRIVEAE